MPIDRFRFTGDKLFGRFVKEYEKFLIPGFQRSYTWTNKNINELWNAIIANDKPYFIGNIVCVESDSPDNRLQIIDGQQRLTTLTIMLIVVRDMLKSLEPTSKAPQQIVTAIERINQYLKDRDLGVVEADKQEYLRLQLGKKSYQYTLERLIQATSYEPKEVKQLNDIQKRILKNYSSVQSLMRSYLKDNSTQDEVNVLLDVEERIRSLQFVVIILNSDEDVYSIFEGLNSTGVGLSVADLLKNALIKAVVDEEKRSNIEKTWDELEEVFFEYGNASMLPKFLRHQWISESGYINTSDLFKEIKRKKLDNQDPNAIQSYASELLRDARVYTAIREWRHLDNLGIKNKLILGELEKYHWLNTDQVYPVIMAMIKKYRDTNTFSDKVLRLYLNKLWNFAFRASYVSLSPSKFEKDFAEICREINNKDSTQAQVNVDAFFAKISKYVSSSEQFIENLVQDMKYTQANIPLIRYLLKVIMKLDDPNHEVSDATIEHIVPQNPTKWGLSVKEIIPYVHKIGNLTLLNRIENAKAASNADMPTKVREVFVKSGFRMNREIATMQDTFISSPEDTIQNRSVQIAKKLEEHLRV